MSKTKSLEFTCDSIKVDRTSRVLNVEVEEPNIDELLSTIHEDDIMEYTRNNFSLEDVYTQSDLEKWAEENGYSK